MTDNRGVQQFGPLPDGEVTFLFTDVEGSTQLLHELGPERYGLVLARHRAIVRAAVAAEGGVEVDTQGDAFFVAFASASAAVAAAAAMQEALASGPVRVRMGVHTGRPHLTAEGYVGEDVHLGARVGAAGHGGQVLLSAATRSQLDGEVAVTDLGEHRLKDFSQPVAIFQLGSARFPPLKTISNTNLPRPASSFVGRERELAAVGALLGGPDRLVTLVGPGGSGKTRLAIEAAAEAVGAFKAGIFWVGLTPLREPQLVVEAIGQTLGVQGDLAAAIGERELLVLLDNFEQVIEAAVDLAALLRASPRLRLLVTSRELLRVDGEVAFDVLPLSDADAVQLFAARACVDSDAAVSELCRRLDNLPLAVELAAARSRVLTPVQILDRLGARLDLLRGGRDADPRQQTLRATIEWSHDLLDAAERRSFARLAVFAGGCTIDTAEAVVQTEVDMLQSLVEKSLLRQSGGRFWMLETIREYAAERLEASGERAALELRFRTFLRRLAHEAFPNLKEQAGPWFDRLEAEHDNLRAALDGAEADGDVQYAFELAGDLFPFWYSRGHLREGRERIERLLELDEAPTAARANAVLAFVPLALSTGDNERAGAAAQTALELQERFGDRWRVAYARFAIGMVAVDRDDFATGLAVMETSEAEFRKLGDAYFARLSLVNVGYCLQQLGRLDEARATLERAIELARSAADERIEASACGQLGTVARMERRFEDVYAYYRRGLLIWSRLGHGLFVGRELGRAAYALGKEGRFVPSTTFLAAAHVVRNETGAVEPWYAVQDAEVLARVHEHLDAATFEAAWSKGSQLGIDDLLALLGEEDRRAKADAMEARSTIGPVEEFVPRDFDVPPRLETPQFLLEPLGPEHNDQDYDAWSSSREHIHATPGWEESSWPREMTLDENRADLQRHADDFRNRTGFTYTVLDPASRDVIGCVYIYPLPDSDHDARALSWVRASHAQLDTPLWRAVRDWLASDWPFGSVEYAPRA